MADTIVMISIVFSYYPHFPKCGIQNSHPMSSDIRHQIKNEHVRQKTRNSNNATKKKEVCMINVVASQEPNPPSSREHP